MSEPYGGLCSVGISIANTFKTIENVYTVDKESAYVMEAMNLASHKLRKGCELHGLVADL